MKFQKLAIAAALGAASTLAVAGGFDGPFVQLGIGGASTSTKVSNLTFDNSDINGNGTKSSGSFNGLVSGGYSQDFGAFNESLKGFNLAANLFYVIGNQNSGNSSMAGVDGWGDQRAGNFNYKLKNTWGISVEPGWNFTESTLGFVKLAWVNTQFNGNGSYSSSSADPSATGTLNESKTLNGFGYGLGVKQLVTKNIFLGVDLMGVTYNSFTPSDSGGANFKPSQFMGFASVGYKF